MKCLSLFVRAIAGLSLVCSMLMFSALSDAQTENLFGSVGAGSYGVFDAHFRAGAWSLQNLPSSGGLSGPSPVATMNFGGQIHVFFAVNRCRSGNCYVDIYEDYSSDGVNWTGRDVSAEANIDISLCPSSGLSAYVDGQGLPRVFGVVGVGTDCATTFLVGAYFQNGNWVAESDLSPAGIGSPALDTDLVGYVYNGYPTIWYVGSNSGTTNI